MTTNKTFYDSQPDKAFWRRAVSSRHCSQFENLASEQPDLTSARIATAGSCFAQHIGRALRARNLQYMDYEPAPAFLAPEEAARFGYGVYSCRYGNVYTVRQLWQLFQEAHGLRRPKEVVWEHEGRYFDALRPGIEPDGFGSSEEVLALRESHLGAVKRLFDDLDVFVFTLGLTEAWTHVEDGTTYPMSPGVIAGKYDPATYRLDNFRYPSIRDDFISFVEGVRRRNPRARFLLTVSPVPLAATATKEHVLVATAYSKSVLRAVAGDLAEDIEGVFYFPSYEIIATHPSRGMYYQPDLRSVCPSGVAAVMAHFFNGAAAPDSTVGPVDSNPTADNASSDVEAEGYEHCEEALLDR
jgi:GSCFA family protein